MPAKLHGDTIFVRSARDWRTDHGIERRELQSESFEPRDRRLRKGPSRSPASSAASTAPSARTPRASCSKAPASRRSSVRKTSVALKLRTDASMRFEKSQDPGEHGARPGTRRGIAGAGLARHSAGGRPGGRKADFKIPAPIELPVDWLSGKLGRPVDCRRGPLDPRIARIRRGRNRSRPFLRHGSELARHQGHLHQGRPARRSGPHARLRFHHAASPADGIRRSAQRPHARLSSAACATWPPRRDSPRSTTTRSSARKWRARSNSHRKHISASPTRSPRIKP